MVSDDLIQETVQRHRDDLDAAVRGLVRQALKGGGEDNITVVAFEISDPAADVEELEKTREHVLPPQEDEADEDTIDELDAVAPVGGGRTAGDTMVVSAAELQAAAVHERRPERRRRRGVLAPALLILLVGLIAVLVVWGLTR